MRIEHKTWYVCEHCGASYSDIEDAKACEADHVTKIKETELNFFPGDKYPRELNVTFKDDTSAIYYMVRIKENNR